MKAPTCGGVAEPRAGRMRTAHSPRPQAYFSKERGIAEKENTSDSFGVGHLSPQTNGWVFPRTAVREQIHLS